MNSLLPPNSSPLERHVEKLTERLELLPFDFTTLWNPDTCATALLPWLSWAFSVDEWDTNWSETQKRKAIKDSAFIHQHKGTRAALERALSSLTINTQVIEWFEHHPPTAPYTFDVESTVSLAELGTHTFAQVIRLINAAKNLRSHYTLRLTTSMDGSIVIGGAALSGQAVSIYPSMPNPELTAAVAIGGVCLSGQETHLFYQGYA